MESAFPGGGESQRLSTAIAGGAKTFDEPRPLQPRKELRHGRGGHAGLARELGPGGLSRRDCVQGEVLRWRQRRLILREHTLDPTAGERRDTAESIRGLLGSRAVPWPGRH